MPIDSKKNGEAVEKLDLPIYDRSSGVGHMLQTSILETYPIHTHTFFEFFYVVNGKAIHQINGENELLSKGSFVLIRPDDIHQYNFFNNYDMELLTCGVAAELMEKALSYMGWEREDFTESLLPPHIILENSDYWDMLKRLNGIRDKEPGPERKRYFLSIFPQLLYQCRETVKRNDSLIPIWLSKLIEEMSLPSNFEQGLERMISLANISQEHLTREFRKHLKITPTEFINTKRINYAAELLLQRKYEILDISIICGYNNLSYFYEVFKKQYNCTPKQFISRHTTS